MPLSEDEQRILREIEENLSATDPKLVQQVSDTTLYRHSARVIKWAVVGFIAGLLLMVFTFTTTLILGVVGFLVMLGCALTIEHNVRKLGKAGMESLTGSMRNGALKRRLPKSASTTSAVNGRRASVNAMPARHPLQRPCYVELQLVYASRRLSLARSWRGLVRRPCLQHKPARA